MGDFWHANVVVSARQEPLRLFVLDWELARTGLPGLEIGLFIRIFPRFRTQILNLFAAFTMKVWFSL